ncbi:hypothetical protein A2U01_0027798, partial [Trifolium medium]|nr:hypothetical protein [Trifolium medium]
ILLFGIGPLKLEMVKSYGAF